MPNPNPLPHNCQSAAVESERRALLDAFVRPFRRLDRFVDAAPTSKPKSKSKENHR